MAREGLSFEAVEAAAKRIEGRGERVTLRGVRAEVGSGSLSTIQRHLEDYQGGKKRETANKVNAELELPARIVQAINEEIEAARAEVTELLSGELDEAKADREALVLEVDRLREENEALTQETSEKIGQLREKAENAERNESALKTKVLGMEAEIAQLKNDLAVANSDLRTEHFKNEVLVDGLAKKDKETKTLRDQLHEEMRDCAKVQASLKECEQKLNEQTELKKSAEAKLMEQAKATKAAETKAENYKTDFEKLDAAFIQLTEQNGKLEEKNKELLLKVKEKELEAADSKREIEALKAKVKKQTAPKAE